MIARALALPRRRLAPLMAVVLLLPCVAVPALAQVQVPGNRVVLRYEDRDVFSYVPAPEALPRQRAVATTINVTYIGFPGGGAEQAAFQFAVDIWEGLVNSPVPIEVEATWEPLDPGVLGSAGAAHIWSGGALPSGYSYADALADAILGYDICSVAGCTGEPDIRASFASTFNWYLGTDGNVPAGKVDLVSVVLHELGHGLGFSGGMRYDDGADTAECTGVAGVGCWSGTPRIYNLFVDSPLNTWILSYTNNTAALGTALTNNQVRWVGTAGTAAYGGAAVPLYSPGTWEPGSSYSHLNEATFGVGNINSLMTPVLSGTEAIHTPGPITLGMFDDMGWSVNGLVDIFADDFESGNTNAWSNTVP